MAGSGNDERQSSTWCPAAAAPTAAHVIFWSASSVSTSATFHIFFVTMADTERPVWTSTGRHRRRLSVAASAATRRRHRDAVSAAGRVVRSGRVGVDRRRGRRWYSRESGRASASRRYSQNSPSDSIRPCAVRGSASQRPRLTTALPVGEAPSLIHAGHTPTPSNPTRHDPIWPNRKSGTSTLPWLNLE